MPRLWRAAVFLCLLACLASAAPALAQSETQPEAQTETSRPHAGGELNLKLPPLSKSTFLGGIDGHTLLLGGLVIAALGLVFGLTIYRKLQSLPVHSSMREISELIYETCKTYLLTQGRFLLILEIFIGAAIIFYFGVLLDLEAFRVVTILVFSLIGIAAAMRSRGLEFASTHSPIPGPPLPACAANRTRVIRFHSKPA
jgi:hypothetical protein